ncbi:uncharacterized protein LOC110459232 [Mizuhopecten yessoensis]|uniref:uncharacterized protein LOC110459232 n=1 Tax=Mizuhopecten yessoensis TaxID=6573 RepID=UPI000B45BB95|nr:uncharacterized protein LOC110459232 [Mizuhopecten yessoensis]
MAAKCTSHKTKVAAMFCESCKEKICQGCSIHEQHTQIPLMDIREAFANLCSEHQFINNNIKSLERKAKESVTSCIKTVQDAGDEMVKTLANVRMNEVEITKKIQKIENGSDPIEEKYLQAKKLRKTESKYSQSQRLVFIQSQNDLGIIHVPKMIGRVEWVAEDQELVELCSFRTSKSSFIKSICPVNSSKAWVLHYTDKAIYLVDCNGQILEERNLGERIEDFCLTTSGEVLFTSWNGFELKKHTKDNRVISLFTFEECYTTRGLCFKGEDVMVCLCSSNPQKPTMLAKMSIADETATKLDYSAKHGFMEPGRVNCTIGDTIAVIDWCDTGRFLKGVDGYGKCLWTWKGEMKTGPEMSPFKPYDVLICNINGEKRFLVTLKGPDWNKICSLDINGGAAKCIYTGETDSCDGAIAADQEGNIWIGDQKGRVHIMKAVKSKG